VITTPFEYHASHPVPAAKADYTTFFLKKPGTAV